jgi:hypothetical protein
MGWCASRILVAIGNIFLGLVPIKLFQFKFTFSKVLDLLQQAQGGGMYCC